MPKTTRFPRHLEGRLAAYLADPMRPFELRSKAALVLLRMGALDQPVGVSGVELFGHKRAS